MTGPADGPSYPQELSGDELLGYLAEVDAELPSGSHIEIAAAGGGALALRWATRTTTDLDIVSEGMPQSLRAAAAVVAERHGLRPDWINDATKAFAPSLDPQLKAAYTGERLRVFVAGTRYLLATKLFSGRDADFDDAVRLATEEGIGDAEEMLNLLSSAYPSRLLTPRVEYYTRQVAEAVRQRALQGQAEEQTR